MAFLLLALVGAACACFGLLLGSIRRLTIWALTRKGGGHCDERRYAGELGNMANPFFEPRPDWDPAREMDDRAEDELWCRHANNGSQPSRRHPLGDFRLDSPLTKRAVDFLKSNVVVVNDTPANRMVLTRHFQVWAKERGLRAHNIRHFTPVVLSAFFVRTRVERDMDMLHQSEAWEANQTTRGLTGPSRFARALLWLLRAGRSRERFPAPSGK